MKKFPFIGLTLSAFVIVISPQVRGEPDQGVPRESQGFADVAQHRGVIDDPDGYVNLRKDKGTDAPIVARVTAGEPFSFERKGNETWCKVKLKSGLAGWMHYSRIKLFFTKDDLPGEPGEGDEIDQQAKGYGINYYEVTRAAVRGDERALKKFLGVAEFADGAAAEEHSGVLSVVIHLIGDAALAKSLGEQSSKFRATVKNAFGDVTYPFATAEYFRQHFPKTAKVLFAD